MKKAFLCVILACVSLSLLLFTACDGLADADHLTLRDFYDSQYTFEVSLDVRKASEGGGVNCHFELPDGKDVSDVRDAVIASLPEGAICETQSVGDIMLFFVRFDEDTLSCFMLCETARRDVEDAPPRYCLNDMTANTSCGDILFPYHLCLDEWQDLVAGQEWGRFYRFAFGYEADIALDYAACKQFYASLGREYITFDDEEQSVTMPHMIGGIFDRRIDEEYAIKMTVGEKILFESVEL